MLITIFHKYFTLISQSTVFFHIYTRRLETRFFHLLNKYRFFYSSGVEKPARVNEGRVSPKVLLASTKRAKPT